MSSTDFTKMVPGFDFLQNLMKGAGGGLPMGQWIAPTLDAEEVDRRIQELRTVQFWLEQNSRLLGTTIQALEVQRMTLATLRTLNLPASELREAMKIDPARFATPAATPADTPPLFKPAPTPEPQSVTPPAAPASGSAATDAPPAVDPMQWWTALTRQFTELATNAIKDLPVPQVAKTVPETAAKTGAAKPRAARKAKAASPSTKTAARKTRQKAD